MSRASTTRSGCRFRPYAALPPSWAGRAPLPPTETRRLHPHGLPENYLRDDFPEDLLRVVLNMLPNSHRFVSPVNRKFRDTYALVVAQDHGKKNEKKKDATCKYVISSEAALELLLNEEGNEENRKRLTSRIGAGSGRTDWVERGGVFDQNTCKAAAKGGQLHVLQWLRAQWPRRRDCSWDYRTCYWAARGGHLKLLKWLREEGCPWDSGTCKGAAMNGYLEVLKWCRGEGCPFDEETCWAAARGGHLDVLKWCREEGSPWNEYTCRMAAQGGHLEILKWCRERGCAWDCWTCIEAAEGGHLEVLQWARGEGCPWNEYTCKMAARNKHLEVLRWAIENRCPHSRSIIRHYIKDPDFLE